MNVDFYVGERTQIGGCVQMDRWWSLRNYWNDLVVSPVDFKSEFSAIVKKDVGIFSFMWMVIDPIDLDLRRLQ